MKPELIKYGGKDPELLKSFIEEFFDFDNLLKSGFFTEEMKNDYYAQAKRICVHLGYESIFQYGSETTRCHISEENPKQFITEFKNIYE